MRLFLLTATENDLQRLNDLLEDLKGRVIRPSGQPPYLGMQELGQFIEEVHTALGDCLQFDHKKVQIKEWHTQIQNNGYECHPSQYSALDSIYGYRNISSHPNEEKHAISSEAVLRRFDDISELLPDLARRLIHHAFIDKLFDKQQCSYHQRRAEELRKAIEAAGNISELLEQAKEFALQFVPEKKRGFLRAPLEHQLKPFLTSLACQCSSETNDILNQLAKHLANLALPILNSKPIQDWLIKYGHPHPPGTAQHRLRVIRLTLDRDPRTSKSLLIRNAAVIEPVIPGILNFLPEFPIPVADLGQLYTNVVRLLNSIRQGLHAVLQNNRGISWQDFVLDIEVPEDLTATDFEFTQGERPGRNLVSTFKCVTMRPLFDYETLHPLTGLNRPIAHPRYRKNSAAIWAINDPETLYQAAQGQDCLFVGPMSWGDGTSVPPIVQAFEGVPSVVVCSADDDAQGLAPLYGDDDQKEWHELLDCITGLRRNGIKLKVLWDDPTYEPVFARSV